MLTCGLNLCDYFNLTELVDTKKRKQNLYLQFKIPTLRDKYVKSTSPKQVFFFFFLQQTAILLLIFDVF